MNSNITADMCGRLALDTAQTAGNADWNNYRTISRALFGDPNALHIALLKGNMVKWEATFDRLQVGAMTFEEFSEKLKKGWPRVFVESEARQIEREAEEAKTVNKVRNLAATIAHDLCSIHTRMDELKKLLGDLE